MSWKPIDTYEEQLIAGKVYTGAIIGVKHAGAWFDITIQTEGGARHKERRYLSKAAMPWTQRFFSGLYYATEAEMTNEIKDFQDAGAHEGNLKDRPFKFILKTKRDADGNDTPFFEITLTGRIKDELTYRKPAEKTNDNNDVFADGTSNAGDDIPF